MTSDAINEKYERLITTQKLAERWHMSPQTITNARAEGRPHLPYVKIGRSVRYKLSDIESAERAGVVSV